MASDQFVEIAHRGPVDRLPEDRPQTMTEEQALECRASGAARRPSPER